jgi:phosphatidate cytidylyltransferase
MSPHAALHSRIFLTYLWIAVGMIALAGGILLLLQHVLRKNVRSIWLTYRGWLMMVPLIAVAVFLGRSAVIVGTTLLAIFGFKEFARATGLYRDWWMTAAVYLAIVAVGYSAWMPDPFNPRLAGWFGLFNAMPVFGSGLLLIIPILRNRTSGQLQAMALAILGFLYIGWMFAHLGYLANTHNPYGYLLFIVLATELNDVAAFTFGRGFGRHPLRSNISPRKTWEGAIGALAVSMGVPWALRFSFRHFDARQLILTGLIVGIGGQLGDLSISVIKRDIGIKDMGTGIPGHGGILDRIDSLIFVAPLFFYMIHYYYGIPWER